MKEEMSPIILLQYLFSILFYPITLEGRRGTTDEFATTPVPGVPENYQDIFVSNYRQLKVN